MNKSKVLTGVLVAAAAGAVIAGLFATKKGKKFRKMVAQKSGDLSDKAIHTFNKLKSKGHDIANKATKEANEVRDSKFAM